MKKLLALVLVLTLVLGMGVGVFAEDYDDERFVTIKKEITLGNSGTVHPAETFSFTVGTGTYDGPIADVTAPAFDPDTFTIGVEKDGKLGSTDINLPVFSAIGEYTYPVTENAGDTAGFVYDNATYYLKVTVLNDGDDGFIRVLTLVDGKDVKTDAFENKFNAGSLVINKEIKGNFAVYDDEFEVTVVLSHSDGLNIKEGPIEVEDSVDDEDASVTKNSDGTVTVTFKVTNDSNVKIKNIPYGVSYAVSEDSGSYEQEILGKQGTISAATQTVGITNTLNTKIETGINLDNLPYILILGVATLGLVGFTMRKRFNNR